MVAVSRERGVQDTGRSEARNGDATAAVGVPHSHEQLPVGEGKHVLELGDAATGRLRGREVGHAVSAEGGVWLAAGGEASEHETGSHERPPNPIEHEVVVHMERRSQLAGGGHCDRHAAVPGGVRSAVGIEPQEAFGPRTRVEPPVDDSAPVRLYDDVLDREGLDDIASGKRCPPVPTSVGEDRVSRHRRRWSGGRDQQQRDAPGDRSSLSRSADPAWLHPRSAGRLLDLSHPPRQQEVIVLEHAVEAHAAWVGREHAPAGPLRLAAYEERRDREGPLVDEVGREQVAVEGRAALAGDDREVTLAELGEGQLEVDGVLARRRSRRPPPPAAGVVPRRTRRR